MTRCQSTPPSRDTASVDSRIVQQVAEREERDPTELPPLYDVIDPDALNTIIAGTTPSDRKAVRVTFTYCGYVVRVNSDNEVRIESSLESESSPESDRGT